MLSYRFGSKSAATAVGTSVSTPVMGGLLLFVKGKTQLDFSAGIPDILIVIVLCMTRGGACELRLNFILHPTVESKTSPPRQLQLSQEFQTAAAAAATPPKAAATSYLFLFLILSFLPIFSGQMLSSKR